MGLEFSAPCVAHCDFYLGIEYHRDLYFGGRCFVVDFGGRRTNSVVQPGDSSHS